MPDLRRLGYFVAVAEERNFTRAAERLHVAQPALSRQVRLLEAELGVDLLRRTTHVVELTEAGALLLERGPALLAEADELWRTAKRVAAGEQGALRLAYGASSGYETAPRLLAALAERLPELEITTRVLPVSGIIEGVREGTLDAGIVRCPPRVPELESHVLRREPQGVLVGREHRLAGEGAIALDALRGETILVHPRDENPGHYDALLALCHDAEPRWLERNVTFDLAFTPVAEGRAVTIVGASAAPVSGSLLWRPLAPPALLDVHVVVRSVNRSAGADRFVATAKLVARELGWLADAESR